MKCPFCSHSETQVVETRIAEDGDFIRRRRQCGSCEKRFTTYERPDVNYPAIVKKDGRRIEYDRAKLLASFNLALRKRPVQADQVEQMVNRIVRQLESLGETEIPSSTVGDFIMKALKGVDEVAYVRYASVYKDFRHTGDFAIARAWAGKGGKPAAKLNPDSVWK